MMTSGVSEFRIWLLGIASTVLGAIGQLLFRRFGLAQPAEGWSAFDVLATPAGVGYLAVGICCYLVAVLLWVAVLRQVPLSRAYPLLSLSYPLVYIGAVVWLGEAMSPLRTLGTSLVTVGAMLAVSAAPSVTQAAAARPGTGR